MYTENDQNRFESPDPNISDGSVAGVSCEFYGRGHPVTLILGNRGGAKVVMESRRTPTAHAPNDDWVWVGDIVDHSNQTPNLLHGGEVYRARIIEPPKDGIPVTFYVRSWRHNHQTTFNHEAQNLIAAHDNHHSTAGFKGTCDCVHCPAQGGSPADGSALVAGQFCNEEEGVNILCDSQDDSIYYIVGVAINKDSGQRLPYHFIMPAGTEVQGLPPSTACVPETSEIKVVTWEQAQTIGSTCRQIIIDDPDPALCQFNGLWIYLAYGEEDSGWYRQSENDGTDHGSGGGMMAATCSVSVNQFGPTISGTTANVPDGRTVAIEVNGILYEPVVQNNMFSVTVAAGDAVAADNTLVTAFVDNGSGCTDTDTFTFSNNGTGSGSGGGSGGVGGGGNDPCANVSITVNQSGPTVSGTTTGISDSRSVFIGIGAGYNAPVTNGQWSVTISAADAAAVNGQIFSAFVEDGAGCSATDDFTFSSTGTGGGGTTTPSCDLTITVNVMSGGIISGTVAGASLPDFIGRGVFVNLGAGITSDQNIDANGNWSITIPAGQASGPASVFTETADQSCNALENVNYTQ